MPSQARREQEEVDVDCTDISGERSRLSEGRNEGKAPKVTLPLI